MDHASSHASSGHTVIFQTVRDTPLYSAVWSPASEGAYAGTCIFLVVLAIVARLLIAYRSVQEARWHDRHVRSRYVAAAGKAPLAERVSQDPDAKSSVVLSENGVEETVMVVQRKDVAPRPWRFSVDPVRAALDTVIVGVGYLL